MKCSQCGRTTKGDKTPPGWRKFCKQDYCQKCKQSCLVVRAVEFPVLKPLNMTWPEFDERIRGMLRHARMLSNWAQSQCYARDVHPAPGMEFDAWRSSMPKIDLYPNLRQKDPVEPLYPHRADWKGCMREASGILRDAVASYARNRTSVLWTGRRSLESYRSVPFPIHNQSWSVALADNGKPVVRLPMPGIGNLDPCTLECVLDNRMRQSSGQRERTSGYDRQMDRVRQLVAGEAEPGEAAIYLRRASTGSHRHTGKQRGQSQANPIRTFIKLVVWMARRKVDTSVRETVLELYTHPEAFWICDRTSPTQHLRVWVENGDHIVARINAHEHYRDRIRQDMKHERRLLHRGNLLAMMEDNQTRRCEKYRQRVDTFIDQSVAAVVGLAERQRAGTLIYTDVCKDYVPSFPWASFRTKLAQRLPPEVTFRHANASQEGAEETEQSCVPTDAECEVAC